MEINILIFITEFIYQYLELLYILYYIFIIFILYNLFKNSKKLVLIIYLFILENGFFNIVDKVWIKDTLGDDNLFKFFIFWNDKLLIILTIYLWQSIFRFDFLEKRTWKKNYFSIILIIINLLFDYFKRHSLHIFNMDRVNRSSWLGWRIFSGSIPRNESSCYPFEERYQGLHRPLDRISSLVKYSLIPITLCYPRFRWISTT